VDNYVDNSYNNSRITVSLWTIHRR